ncbi:MAG: dihydrodipicolinate synthase family protein [Acidobacteria bacterium]|nr:MAG: dihydrodipicolinate synthase family protein [Acidobacteriota bacterium]
MTELEGIFAPPITPFDRQGAVDEPALRDLVEYLIEQGVHVLFPLGSVGMGPAMTPDERQRTAEIIVDQTRGRIPIVLHVGAVDTQTSVVLSRHAAELGVAAIALIPPYYYRHTEFEIIEHYRAVSEAAPLPIYLYNNPALSGITITASLAARLRREIPAIAGVKLTEDRMKTILDYLRTMPAEFAVLAGFNYYLTAAVPLGVCGSVDPLSTFFPKHYLALWNALRQEDYRRAFALQLRLNEAESAILDMMSRVGRSVYQEILKLRGLPIQMYPRWRAQQLNSEDIDALRTILKRVDEVETA